MNWSKEFECCIECKTTEVKYGGRGLCRTCYSKLLHKEEVEKRDWKDRRKPQGWSRNHDKCKNCSTIEIPHAGNGLCKNCFSLRYRRPVPVKWARDYDCCIKCGRTEVSHAQHGLCRGCARKEQSNTYTSDKWSKKYDNCIDCGTVEKQHVANGRCRTCHSNFHYKKVDKKWAKDYDSCINCGETKVAHMAKGLCSTCYSNQRNRELGIPERGSVILTLEQVEEKRKKHMIQIEEWRKKNNYIYSQIHPDKAREINKKYREVNWIKIGQWGANRRALLEGAEGTFTEKEWVDKLEEFGWTCAYCGCDLKELQSKDITRDHIVPLAKKGSNLIDNIVPACRVCNCSKSDLDAFEFIAKLSKSGSD